MDEPDRDGDEPTSAIVLGPDTFAQLREILPDGIGEVFVEGRESGKVRIVLVESDGDRRMVDLLGPNFRLSGNHDDALVGDALVDGNECLYLVEGHSSAGLGSPPDIAMLGHPSVRHGKSTMKPSPNENGFYRQFEQRRPDGTVKRGKRR
jgi:hypothetical protein